MPTLTSGEAKDLARYFLSLATSINNYRIEKWEMLTLEERKALGDLHWQINNQVDDLTALSTTLILEDSESELIKIKTITEDIKKTIHKIEMVQKVINIAAAVVAVGGAIIARNTKAIGSELNGLSKAWNEDLPSEIAEKNKKPRA